jgi:hypothetical protein
VVSPTTLHTRPQKLAPTPRVEIEAIVRSPEDVDMPNDGKWDLIAAHEFRFCFQHGEDEWLLESDNNWMHASDFNIPGADAALEAKLQKYESNPWDLDRCHLAFRQNATAIFGLMSILPYGEANSETESSIRFGGNYVGLPRATSMT